MIFILFIIILSILYKKLIILFFLNIEIKKCKPNHKIKFYQKLFIFIHFFNKNISKQFFILEEIYSFKYYLKVIEIKNNKIFPTVILFYESNMIFINNNKNSEQCLFYINKFEKIDIKKVIESKYIKLGIDCYDKFYEYKYIILDHNSIRS